MQWHTRQAHLNSLALPASGTSVCMMARSPWYQRYTITALSSPTMVSNCISCSLFITLIFSMLRCWYNFVIRKTIFQNCINYFSLPLRYFKLSGTCWLHWYSRLRYNNIVSWIYVQPLILHQYSLHRCQGHIIVYICGP